MASPFVLEKVRFSPRDEPDILLEGRLHLPAGRDTPLGAALICHPDPRMGGTMDFPALSAIADALAGRDILALRFNFRGIGDSGRTLVGDAYTEVNDAAGALDLLQGRFGAVPCFAAGYSFGAVVALRLAERQPAIAGAALIALPQTYISPAEPLNRELPRLFVIAEKDQITDPAWAVDFAARCRPPGQTHVLRDANHFLWQREAEAASVVAAFCTSLIP